MSDEIDVEMERICDDSLRHHPNTIAGKMERVRSKFARIVSKDLPRVRKLDPDGTSRIAAALRSRLQELLNRWGVWSESDPFQPSDENGFLTEEADRNARSFLSELESALRHASDCAHTLIGAHETMGLTPHDIERLVDRYDVELWNGLIDWSTIHAIEERVFVSKMRSENALSRKPRVSDEEIKMVVGNVKGQGKQAKALHITVRQLQRRLKKIKEA